MTIRDQILKTIEEFETVAAQQKLPKYGFGSPTTETIPAGLSSTVRKADNKKYISGDQMPPGGEPVQQGPAGGKYYVPSAGPQQSQDDPNQDPGMMQPQPDPMAEQAEMQAQQEAEEKAEEDKEASYSHDSGYTGWVRETYADVYNKIEKQIKIYLEEGDKAPKGVQIRVGPHGGKYYIGNTKHMEQWKSGYRRDLPQKNEAVDLDYRAPFKEHKTTTMDPTTMETLTGMNREELVDHVVTEITDPLEDDLSESQINKNKVKWGPKINECLDFMDWYSKLARDPNGMSDNEVKRVGRMLHRKIVTENVLNQATSEDEGKTLALGLTTEMAPDIEAKLDKLMDTLRFEDDKTKKIIAIDSFIGLNHRVEPTLIPHTFGLPRSYRIPLQDMISYMLDALFGDKRIDKEFIEIRKMNRDEIMDYLRKGKVYNRPGKHTNETLRTGPRGGIFHLTDPGIVMKDVGVSADTFTPTFGSDSKAKLIQRINAITGDKIEKYKVYLQPGEKPPKGVMVQRSPRGKMFYDAAKRPVKLEINEPKRMNVKRDDKKNMRPLAPGQTHTPAGIPIPLTGPKAWTNVMVAKDNTYYRQATGTDSAGRPGNALYLPSYQKKNNNVKFDKQLQSFTKVYDRIESRLIQDRHTSEEAAVLYMITKTGFRIGSNNDTKAKVKAYGATTLQGRHISVKGDSITFTFVAKKGTKAHKTITDSFLAKKFKGIKGDTPLFKTDDYKVTKYLKGIPLGRPYSPKDFRMYFGTQAAIRKINELPEPTSEKEFKAFRNAVGDYAAQELCNTRKVALGSYVSPVLFDQYDALWPNVIKKEDYDLEDDE
jgi:DNA topoisomerase-1